MTTVTALAAEVIAGLRGQASPANVAGMARYGISTDGTLGVPMPWLRKEARSLRRALGKNNDARHQLAAHLWASGLHEARILSALLDEPSLVTELQAESWVRDLDSWDVCDQLCSNLLDRTAFAYEKAAEWSSRDELFVKRAGFVLMAQLAVHDKQSTDDRLLAFLPIIEREAADERPLVRKAVNWALRQIGKRSAALHAPSLALAERLRLDQRKSARWVGSDAARELDSEAVRLRLGL